MLLDFNLAQDAQRHSARVGGTIPYMAPEQLQQLFIKPTNKPVYNARSEVFSLGVILYELLTGTLPFGEYRENLGEELAQRCIAVAPEYALAYEQAGRICMKTGKWSEAVGYLEEFVRLPG